MGLVLRDTFGLLRAGLPVVALLVLLPSLFQGLGLHVSAGTEVVLIAVASYFLHRQFLLGEQLGKSAADRGGPPSAILPYLLYLAVQVGAFVALAVLLSRGLDLGRAELSGLGVNLAWAGPGGFDGGLGIVCMFVAQVLVFGLFGTALPAAAVHGIWGPGVRAQKFPATPLRVAGLLIAGPWAICTALMLGLFATAELVLPALPDPARPAIALPGLGLIIAGRLIMAFGLAMVVVILSRAYLGNTATQAAPDAALPAEV